ncbi:MAG: hypothetical protein ACJ788_15745 [Ktedonobacteraceae bacterium]|jgi:hypothetical protein
MISAFSPSTGIKYSRAPEHGELLQVKACKALSEKDKQIVEEHMHSYDSLLDQDPYLQQQRALERALGRTEGIQAFQNTVVEIVKNRFPTLVDLAQQKVVQIQEISALQRLVVQLSTARNQTTARRILQTT